MKRLVIPALLAFVVSAAALAGTTPPPWKTVATIKAQSTSYAYTGLLNVNVVKATTVRVRVQASSIAKITGSVYCSALNLSDAAVRTIGFSSRSGYHTLSLPLKKASCTYFLSGTLAGAGNLTLTLQVRR